jgi:hypothetical protein
MSKLHKFYRDIVLVSVALIYSYSSLHAQKRNINLGAYYFDGWTGIYPSLITESLKRDYSQRQPKWGWITSSQRIMNEQIILASNSGLSFFSFCWYNNLANKNKRLNDALQYYLKSPNNKRLGFSLLIANHSGAEIEPAEWDELTDKWLTLFRNRNYFKINNLPLISFFSVKSLVTKFGSPENVKHALYSFRLKAKKAGFQDLIIAACVSPSKEEIDEATVSGFDTLTGYNYHGSGLDKSKNQQVPIDSMRVIEEKVWTRISYLSKLRYIPPITLNWDPRPWANSSNKYATAPYFVGFSSESVYRSIKAYIEWASKRPNDSRVAILYAWNEYGEGAYLTPAKNGDNPLKGLKRAIN